MFLWVFDPRSIDLGSLGLCSGVRADMVISGSGRQARYPGPSLFCGGLVK